MTRLKFQVQCPDGVRWLGFKVEDIRAIAPRVVNGVRDGLIIHVGRTAFLVPESAADDAEAMARDAGIHLRAGK